MDSQAWKVFFQEHKASNGGYNKRFENKVDWKVISQTQKIPEEFEEDCKFNIDWNETRHLSKLMDILDKVFKNRWEGADGFVMSKICEEFFEEHKDKLDWEDDNKILEAFRGFYKRIRG